MNQLNCSKFLITKISKATRNTLLVESQKLQHFDKQQLLTNTRDQKALFLLLIHKISYLLSL